MLFGHGPDVPDFTATLTVPDAVHPRLEAALGAGDVLAVTGHEGAGDSSWADL
jgi:hypothetical protein